MNPVLASTSEFDQYLSSRLKLNSAADKRKSNITQSARTSSGLNKPPISKADTSASQTFLELNTKKYIISETRNSRQNLRDPTPANEFEDPLKVGHSWRAHLNTANRDVSPSAINIPTGRSTHNYSKSTPMIDVNSHQRPVSSGGNRSPLPNPPLSYNRQRSPPSVASSRYQSTGSNRRNNDTESISNTLSNLSIHNRNSCEDDEVDDFRHRYTSKSPNKQSSHGIDRPTTSEHRTSVENGELSNKARWVILARCIQCWQVEAKLSKGMLIAKSRVLTRTVQTGSKHFLKGVFRDWYGFYQAENFNKKYIRFQAKNALRRWRKSVAYKQRNEQRAKRYQFQHVTRSVIDMLLLNVRQHRRINKNKHMMAKALTFSKNTLLNFVMSVWKSHTRKARGEKQIGEEQNIRREKIQQFMNNIAARREGSGGGGGGSSSSEHKHDQNDDINNNMNTRHRDTSSASSSSRDRLSAASDSKDPMGVGRSRSDSKDSKPSAIPRAASAGRTRPPLSTTSNRSAGLGTSVSSTARTVARPSSAALSGRQQTNTSTTTSSRTTINSARQSNSHSPPPLPQKLQQSPHSQHPHPHSHHSRSVSTEYDSDEFEPVDAGNEDDDQGVTPPPSYNALVGISGGGGGSGSRGVRDREAFNKGNSEFSSGNSGVRSGVRGATSGASGSQNQNHKWVSNTTANTVGVGTASSGGGFGYGRAMSAPRGGLTTRNNTTNLAPPKELTSFEQRAIERKEKQLLLRRQAEERVSARQREEQERNREKSAKEVEEAEKIRHNARLKLENTKAVSQRAAEMTEETRRQLNRARAFHRVHVMIQFGFAPWRRYVEQIRLDEHKAANFHNDTLLQSAWSALLGYVVAVRTERIRREHRLTAGAVAHYRRKLIKFTWRLWRMFHKVLKAKAAAVTGHFSRFTLCRRSFNGWKIAYERRLRESARKMRSVAPRGNRVALRYYFANWRQHLESSQFDREIRNRADYKWAAVQSWLKK